MAKEKTPKQASVNKRLDTTKFQFMRRRRDKLHREVAGFDTPVESEDDVRKFKRYLGWVFDGRGVPPDELELLCKRLKCREKDIVEREDLDHRKRLATIAEIAELEWFYSSDEESSEKLAQWALEEDRAAKWHHVKPKDELASVDAQELTAAVAAGIAPFAEAKERLEEEEGDAGSGD